MFKDDVPAAFMSQVQTKFNTVETYLNNINSGRNYSNLCELIDVNSIIDQWLVLEIAMNDEFKHPKSYYLTINGTGGANPGDGKIHGGPVWDFDWAAFPNVENRRALGDGSWNDTGYNKFNYTGKTTQYNYVWIPKLMNNSNFKARVKERWARIYPVLKANIPSFIEEQGRLNSRSFVENETMWCPGYESRVRNGDEGYATYNEIVVSLRYVFETRLEGMNTLINNLK